MSKLDESVRSRWCSRGNSSVTKIGELLPAEQDAQVVEGADGSALGRRSCAGSAWRRRWCWGSRHRPRSAPRFAGCGSSARGCWRWCREDPSWRRRSGRRRERRSLRDRPAAGRRRSIPVRPGWMNSVPIRWPSLLARWRITASLIVRPYGRSQSSGTRIRAHCRPSPGGTHAGHGIGAPTGPAARGDPEHRWPLCSREELPVERVSLAGLRQAVLVTEPLRPSDLTVGVVGQTEIASRWRANIFIGTPPLRLQEP